ncbi:hypothetical protein [Antarcticirhabdus aurantiaca]|uniref:Uncharacterized protein n=1 Tax=Antarcticirhabdus aurantiaca TaxID=2606717 RepID=A0ACD4NWM3_9HYPH|nr:hypothetical protein [Antarcticirhabdus aurantiaca]WAJ31061.1 hypothetical protein OXU80_13015 [Jeongeuplla avenae]
MIDKEESMPGDRLRYVAAMLKELAQMLPPPRRSMLAYLVHMACLEAESELARRESSQP